MSKNHNNNERLVVIGGTFDALHQGHKDYILKAFTISRKALIYVSADRFIDGLKDYENLPYTFRVRQITKFIENEVRDPRGKSVAFKIKKLLGKHTLVRDFTDKTDIGGKITHALLTNEYKDEFLGLNELRRQTGLEPLNLKYKRRSCTKENIEISSSGIRSGSIQDFACNYRFSKHTGKLFVPA